MIDLGWYRGFLVVFAVAMFFTNFADFSQRYGFTPLLWIIVLGGLSLPVALPAVAGGSVEVPPLLVWSAAYLLISIGWFYVSVQNARSFQEVQTRVLSVIFLAIMLFAFARPEEQRLARRAVAWATLLAVGLNIYELFNPMTFSDIPGRSSGLYTNVNQSGAALVLGLVIAYTAVPARLRLPFAAAVAIGILTTFSRAAMVGWVLVVLYFMLRGGLGLAQIRRVLAVCAVVVAFLASPYWGHLQTSLEQRGVLTMDVLERLSFFGGKADDASAQERSGVAAYAWRLFGDRPLTGYGTGASRQMEEYAVGTHNIYLAMMVDHGIVGLFIAPAMVLAAIWGARRGALDLAVPFAAFVVLWGLFSHNVLEERYILLSVALVASIVASQRAPRALAEPRAPALLPARSAA